MLDHEASAATPLSPVEGEPTVLSGGDLVQAQSTPVASLAAGSATSMENTSVDPVENAEPGAEHPIAESAILDESDQEPSHFAEFDKASWLPPHPLITDPQRHIGAVFGAYRILELLGKGGMGYVYRAEHVKLGRSVALKLLRTDYGARKDAISRFFREAKTVNRIRHRNIVDVTDFVELGDGTAFIIMELLRGQSFGKWARSGVDLARALAVLVQICDGLGAAHAVGVIHRDLKPDNIVVIPTADGTELVKLLDFGVAKLTRRHDGDASYDTQVGALVGTPAYMSPEQAGGMVIDHRSDIYSLGTLMYELFCNQPMFRGRSFGEYVRKHLTEIPTLPRSTQGGASMPIELERIIMRCLEKDPNARYDNSFKLRDDLMGVLANLGRAEARTPESVEPPWVGLPKLASPPAATHSAPLPKPTVSRRAWWIAGTLIAGGGVAGAMWMTETEKPSSSSNVIMAEPILTTGATAGEPSGRAAKATSLSKATFVELRFNSVPRGTVYAAGHSAELCRTPCAFNVDLRDSESTNARTFVVRSEGYKEQTITIDLNAPQREFHVALERSEPEPEPTQTVQLEQERVEPVTEPPARSESTSEPPEVQVSRARAAERLEKSPSARKATPNAGRSERAASTAEPKGPSADDDDFSALDPEDGQTEHPEQVSAPIGGDPGPSPTQGIAPNTTHNPFQRRR